MMKLGVDFSARVPGGPAFVSSTVVDAHALDRLVVEVTQGTPLTVDLQPAAAEKLLLLAASSTPPAADAGANVTAVIQDGSGGSAKKTVKLPLDKPIMLVGSALALLPGAPRQMVLEYAGSASTAKATVEIMIARTV